MKKILVLLLLAPFLSSPSYADESFVAKVNGVGIPKQELEAQVERMIPRLSFHGGVSDEKRAEYREKALNGLIDRELQYQEAMGKGMTPDKREVKAVMSEIRDRFKSKKEYRDTMEKAGMTENSLKKQVEKGVLVQELIKKTVTDPSRFSEEKVKDYYDANMTKFVQPESVKIRIISTKDEKKAQEILAKVKAGNDFGDIAARMSEDGFRIKGGDMGYIHRGRIYPELEKAAFELKPGEVSELIRSEETWFVVKVEDKMPARQVGFDEIKGKLKKDLETAREEELRTKWISDLRAKAKIEILSEQLP
jgi:parvulin-like peptidyl-prolyl isomerase